MAVEIFTYGVQENGLSCKCEFEAISLWMAFKRTFWERSKPIVNKKEKYKD